MKSYLMSFEGETTVHFKGEVLYREGITGRLKKEQIDAEVMVSNPEEDAVIREGEKLEWSISVPFPFVIKKKGGKKP